MTQKTIKFYADAAKTTQVYPELDSAGVTSALGYTPVNSNKIGANSGIAELDASGKVPTSQLPSYVDDVIEGYYYSVDGKFYKDSAHITEIVGETGKIYVSLDTNQTYRWSGSAFIGIASDLALGETSSTAYRGDRGKIAYDHSQAVHAPSNAEVNTIDTIKNNNIALTPSNKTVNIDTISFAKADSSTVLFNNIDSPVYVKILEMINQYLNGHTEYNQCIVKCPSGNMGVQVKWLLLNINESPEIQNDYVNIYIDYKILQDSDTYNRGTVYGITYKNSYGYGYFSKYIDRASWDNKLVQFLWDDPACTTPWLTQNMSAISGNCSMISYGNILGMNNTTSWTPTGDYNPATKKYVDDNVPTFTLNGDTLYITTSGGGGSL